ncbi:FAD binding domain-containing protein [Labrys monachus]|uniref:Carbon-monoxide dehydrogenase medium subunit n=1 Tax=Labrys monachus TaxID=217067 RepID=A0ABU0FGA7_9HYPH|nr:xanthine dehydrogenase family protein subunit M [Labrys monachus]MDQ0393620.1 carbon-monoxide dehydrogenase medium subunit [Labrys monachus]
MSIVLPNFSYHRPVTLSDALALHGGSDDAMFIAGGHTLLPVMKAGLAAPDTLIDLRAIPDLQGIDIADGLLRIGGGATHVAVSKSETVRTAIPVLAALAGSIGDVQVRNRGTIGGSVANNDPAADYPSAVLALDATVVTDRRSIAAGDYFTGLYATALEPGEIVTALTFPIPASAGYAKFRNPASRYAMAAVFVSRLGDGSIRVAVTGAGNEGVFRWAEAEEALARDFSAQALDGAALDPDSLIGDIHASTAYRANLVRVMARRAVQNQGKASIFS